MAPNGTAGIVQRMLMLLRQLNSRAGSSTDTSLQRMEAQISGNNTASRHAAHSKPLCGTAAWLTAL